MRAVPPPVARGAGSLSIRCRGRLCGKDIKERNSRGGFLIMQSLQNHAQWHRQSLESESPIRVAEILAQSEGGEDRHATDAQHSTQFHHFPLLLSHVRLERHYGVVRTSPTATDITNCQFPSHSILGRQTSEDGSTNDPALTAHGSWTAGTGRSRGELAARHLHLAVHLLFLAGSITGCWRDTMVDPTWSTSPVSCGSLRLCPGRDVSRYLREV